MRHRTKIFAAVATISAATTASLSPYEAHAYGRRLQGSICQPVEETLSTSSDTRGLIMGSAGSYRRLLCPIVADTDIPHQSINTLNVYLHRDASEYIDPPYVKACRTYSTTDGGTCGNNFTLGDAGEALAQPSRSALSDSTGFPYVFIRILANDTVRAVYYTD
jgi:hypothetical protein